MDGANATSSQRSYWLSKGITEPTIVIIISSSVHWNTLAISR